LDELSSLRELSLPSHSLTGTIPGWLAQYLPQLIYLDLSYNELKLGIPSNLLQMSSLEILLLNDNQLSGTLPSSSSSSEVANDALQVLTLHHNGNLAGNVSPLCENGSLLMGYDCATSLQCTCCAACCPTDEDCYHDELRNTIVANEGLWEFKYERSPFGMEPERMDANDLFAVLHQQQP
jgi:hypothetical protein